MKLYIFRCRTRPKMFGATRYETASNLPTQKCPGGWEFFQRVDLTPRGTLRYAVDTATVRRHVEQRGWHVWDETPRDEEKDAAATRPLPREVKPPEPQRIVSNVSSHASGDSWKDKLEEPVSALPQEHRVSPTPTAEIEALAEDVVKETARGALPRDYNFVRPIADLLSTNPSPVKTRPVERPTRAPVERSIRVPVETSTRVPTETPARVPPETPARFSARKSKTFTHAQPHSTHT